MEKKGDNTAASDDRWDDPSPTPTSPTSSSTSSHSASVPPSRPSSAGLPGRPLTGGRKVTQTAAFAPVTDAVAVLAKVATPTNGPLQADDLPDVVINVEPAEPAAIKKAVSTSPVPKAAPPRKGPITPLTPSTFKSASNQTNALQKPAKPPPLPKMEPEEIEPLPETTFEQTPLETPLAQVNIALPETTGVFNVAAAQEMARLSAPTIAPTVATRSSSPPPIEVSLTKPSQTQVKGWRSRRYELVFFFLCLIALCLYQLVKRL